MNSFFWCSYGGISSGVVADGSLEDYLTQILTALVQRQHPTIIASEAVANKTSLSVIAPTPLCIMFT